MRLKNPFAFRSGPVTFWTTAIYLAIIVSLIYVHETVPSAPSPNDWPDGVNLTEAWLDLQAITRQYHPYNSHENDVVRDYLMRRAQEILAGNGVDYETDLTGGIAWDESYLTGRHDELARGPSTSMSRTATIFDDTISNVTYAERNVQVGQYFEGSNFYVYIHGSEDPEGDWWRKENAQAISSRGAGVLVNCHLDSVSTGYGATDDGVACVSLLQILSYFTVKAHQPKHGIVLLFNNAEEDGLLGARAFGYSPLLRFCHAFVNLEGAGAGGRAMLFRATDLEAAKAYSKSPHPLGSIVTANGFERGFIRSGTDYTVFVENFGQRGLDIAFYHPRARYHTEEDDARHTSVDSIWHMLSAAIASTESLAENVGTLYSGVRSDGRKDLIQNGHPTAGVWFDWLGSAWSAFPLRGLFAWTLTLLITTPLALVLFIFILVRSDKFYFFAGHTDTVAELDQGRIPLGGWKGLTRLPLTLIIAGGLAVGAVLMLAKVNPLIIYSSGYAVWAMMFSMFYFVSWLLLRGANFIRPSALQRGYALIWLFLITWVLSIFAAVAEDRMNIGGVYTTAFLHSFVFGAVSISLLEQLRLPSKEAFARQSAEGTEDRTETSDGSDADSTARFQHGSEDTENEAAPTETTPLRPNDGGYGSSEPTTTFATTYRQSLPRADAEGTPSKVSRGYSPYEGEQEWSGRLPSWTWLVQFLLLGTVYVIVLGNLALVQTTAVSMTGTDGSNLLHPILFVGVFTIMLLLPLMPFLHRVSYHIPVLLLTIFAATLVYNLLAFPFSVNNRFKFYFQQVVDLENRTNTVSLMGLEDFVRPVIRSLPTAAGQQIVCTGSSVRADVKTCRFDASLLPPDVANGTDVDDLVSIEAKMRDNGNSIEVKIDALNTRTCFVDTSFPVVGFSVEGGGRRDERFGSFPPDGIRHIQLWRRKWEGPWTTTLQIGGNRHSSTGPLAGYGIAREGQGPKEGELRRRHLADTFTVTARCAWSDINNPKTIPAFHEVRQFMPPWSTVTKAAVGLVEVKKTVQVTQ